MSKRQKGQARGGSQAGSTTGSRSSEESSCLPGSSGRVWLICWGEQEQVVEADFSGAEQGASDWLRSEWVIMLPSRWNGETGCNQNATVTNPNPSDTSSFRREIILVCLVFCQSYSKKFCLIFWIHDVCVCVCVCVWTALHIMDSSKIVLSDVTAYVKQIWPALIKFDPRQRFRGEALIKEIT